MTLEQVAYLSEIIGVVLIVVSLIYVAQQLRQNTNMARITASEKAVQADFDIVKPLLENREFAEVWVKGGELFEELDEVDKQRLLIFERRPIVYWHHVFQLRQQDLIPDADWRSTQWAIRSFGRRQALRVAWGAFKEGFDEPFRNFMEEQFAIADRSSATG